MNDQCEPPPPFPDASACSFRGRAMAERYKHTVIVEFVKRLLFPRTYRTVMADCSLVGVAIKTSPEIVPCAGFRFSIVTLASRNDFYRFFFVFLPLLPFIDSSTTNDFESFDFARVYQLNALRRLSHAIERSTERNSNRWGNARGSVQFST